MEQRCYGRGDLFERYHFSCVEGKGASCNGLSKERKGCSLIVIVFENGLFSIGTGIAGIDGVEHQWQLMRFPALGN
jgi:hypothetical protein